MANSILLVCAAFAMPLGCTSRSGSESDVHSANSTTLVVALSAGPSTLDPRVANDATSVRLVGLMFSALIRIGDKLDVVGDAATDWTFKDRQYIFNLRPGLKFSNGRSLTQDDLDYSFHEFTKPTGSNGTTFELIDRIETRYDNHERWAKIHLRGDSAAFLRDLVRIKFLPHPETVRLGAGFATQPIGTGPYAFESQSSNEIVLRARTDHPYASPKIPHLVFKIVRDDNTRLFKLFKGEIDIAQQELSPSKIAIVVKNPEFEVIKKPGLSVSYLIFNLRDPVLKSTDFRRALDLAIDRAAIVHFKQLDLATPASSLLSAANPFHDARLLPTPFDLNQSIVLLKQLSKTLPLKEPLSLKTSNNPAAVENGRVVANGWNQALEKIGAHVRTQSYEWGTFYGDVQRGNFQVALMRWTGVIDPNQYRTCFLSTEIPPDGKNRGYYNNPKLDVLLDQGLRLQDFNQRKEIYDQVQEIVAQDRPILPLWYEYEVTVLNRRVKNYRLSDYADYFALTAVSK